MITGQIFQLKSQMSGCFLFTIYFDEKAIRFVIL